MAGHALDLGIVHRIGAELVIGRDPAENRRLPEDQVGLLGGLRSRQEHSACDKQRERRDEAGTREAGKAQPGHGNPPWWRAPIWGPRTGFTSTARIGALARSAAPAPGDGRRWRSSATGP